MSRQWMEEGYSMTSGKNVSDQFRNGDNAGMLFRKSQKNLETVKANPNSTTQQIQKANDFSHNSTKAVIRSAAERRALETSKNGWGKK